MLKLFENIRYYNHENYIYSTKEGIKLIDIHSHILPGIDDGAKDLETSIRMLEMAENDNTKIMFATPHYYHGHYEATYDEVVKNIQILQYKLKNKVINVEIYPGQEVFLDKFTVELYKSGIIKGLNDSNYLLLELPMENYSKSFIDIIYELRLLGARPIIAHPERYSYILDNIYTINEFIQEGCLVQLNSGSIIGNFGKSVERTAKKLIENGVCNFIASDAHTANRRCPGLVEAMKIVGKINNSVAVEVQINAELLLQNENIKRDSNIIKVKRNFFDFLK